MNDISSSLDVQTTYSIDELKRSMRLAADYNFIQVCEQPLDTEEKRLEKFLNLQDLSAFIKDVTTLNVNSEKAYETLVNRSMLAKISLRAAEN